MTAHGATAVDNLWEGVGDGNDGCWAIKARDERHHPRWLIAIGSAWHSLGRFPAARFADRGQPGAMQMPRA